METKRKMRKNKNDENDFWNSCEMVFQICKKLLNINNYLIKNEKKRKMKKIKNKKIEQ